MNKERFEELSQAIRQAKAVRRGEAAPSRVWNVTRGKDGKLHRRQLDPEQYRREQKVDWENSVTDTRSKLRSSQSKFAQPTWHLDQDATLRFPKNPVRSKAPLQKREGRLKRGPPPATVGTVCAKNKNAFS